MLKNEQALLPAWNQTCRKQSLLIRSQGGRLRLSKRFWEGTWRCLFHTIPFWKPRRFNAGEERKTAALGSTGTRTQLLLSIVPLSLIFVFPRTFWYNLSMKQTLTAKLKLKTTPEQFAALRTTQLAYRDALNCVSRYAFEHGKISSTAGLHKGTYQDVRSKIHPAFPNDL